MFINSKTVENNKLFRTKVCIIGGGVAGISLTLELSKNNIDCCLIESGGLKSDLPTMDLYRGENVGMPYQFADGHRTRYLGGSSNCWGGWCAPFDTHDFEKRDWIDNSGWPITLNDLVPFYKRTHPLLKLGEFKYCPEHWQASINREDVKRFTFKSGKIVDKISQFSPPAKLGIVYRSELEDKKNPLVFLYGNVTKLQATEPGNAITHAIVKSLNGNVFSVQADYFIVATGGIENARLLLASNDIHKKGLGNNNDLVGRYFMDHPRLLWGNVKFTKEFALNRLYDMKYNWHNPKVGFNGISIAGQLALTEEVQQKEQVSNARVCFMSAFYGELNKGPQTLFKYKNALLKKYRDGLNPKKDILSILSSPIDVTSYVITRMIKPRFLINNIKLQIILEQEPNPNNRIMIGRELDALGMPRVVVDWKLGKQEQRTIDKTFRIFAEELQANNLVKSIEVEPVLNDEKWPSEISGTWHHMGTTRMHDSPKHGVVDKDCKVHGVDNLFMAGSSVFPTSGANFPTITLAALALRLADHIAEKAK